MSHLFNLVVWYKPCLLDLVCWVQATFVESSLPVIGYPNMVLMIQNYVGRLFMESRYVASLIMQTFVNMAGLSSDSCVCQVQATPQDGLAKHGTVRVVI